eukprot:scaffold109637_cov36-Phaeocystis_antarctica.AAC.1
MGYRGCRGGRHLRTEVHAAIDRAGREGRDGARRATHTDAQCRRVTAEARALDRELGASGERAELRRYSREARRL